MACKKIDNETCQRVLNLRRAGWTVRKIAEHCGVSPTFVMVYCGNHGFSRRSCRVTSAQVDQVIRLDRGNQSAPVIARSAGMSVEQVRTVLKQLGRVAYSGKAYSYSNDRPNTLDLRPEHLAGYKEVVRARKAMSDRQRESERV